MFGYLRETCKNKSSSTEMMQRKNILIKNWTKKVEDESWWRKIYELCWGRNLTC